LSSASTLPLEPFESDSFESGPVPADAIAVTTAAVPGLKQQVAERLAQHRQRRGSSILDSAPPQERERAHPVAAAVAARFSQTVSYRDFLAMEAEAATRKAEEERRQAEAAAEVARRSAEAIATAQRELMEDLAEWNARIAAANAANPHLATAQEKAATASVPGKESAEEERDAGVTLPAPAGPVSGPASFAVETASFAVEAMTLETRLQAAAIAAEPTMAVLPEVKREASTRPVLDLPHTPSEPSVGISANLIEFPRQLVAARKARPRLAEGPLREGADATPERSQLRIFEVVPEMLSPQLAVESALPEWSTIRLEASSEPYAPASLAAQMSFALPPQTASLQVRGMAAAVDVCCIGAAFVGFVAAAAYVSPEMPSGKVAVISGAGVLVVLTLLYQLLCFTLSDATPGMRYARIGLCTFADENPTRSAMRLRIFALLLAAFPAGIGFFWACVDDDGLGWHDRISRMYQRSY